MRKHKNVDLDEDIEIEDFDDEREEIDEEEIEIDRDDDLSPVFLSKHKMQSKHALKYDTIFKGKKEDPLDEWEDFDTSTFYESDSLQVDTSTSYHTESINNEEYVWDKKLKEKIYKLLSENTEIDFEANRRRPSRVDFNEYYKLLKDNLSYDGFTSVEIFTELSIYFSDNLLNMFKLLDHNWRLEILEELRSHIGKRVVKLELKKSNIEIGTEVEFDNVNELGEYKTITGRVIDICYDPEVDELEDIFKIDSYEKVYSVKFQNITKILNNKFKYNMDKLDYIDFL